MRLLRATDGEKLAWYYQKNRAHFKPWQPARSVEFDSITAWQQRLPIMLRHQKERYAVFFVLEASESIIGHCTLSQISYGAFGACYMGYAVDEDEQGKGHMTQGLKTVIDYAFGEMRLHRIMANYLPHNDRSAQLLQRLGFEIEGKAKQYLAIDGQWQDHILTALTNEHRAVPVLK